MPNRAERVKRGFMRLAVVGSLAALILAGMFYFGEQKEKDAAFALFLTAVAWSVFWLFVSWIVRGFMDEGS